MDLPFPVVAMDMQVMVIGGFVALLVVLVVVRQMQKRNPKGGTGGG